VTSLTWTNLKREEEKPQHEREDCTHPEDSDVSDPPPAHRVGEFAPSKGERRREESDESCPRGSDYDHQGEQEKRASHASCSAIHFRGIPGDMEAIPRDALATSAVHWRLFWGSGIGTEPAHGDAGGRGRFDVREPNPFVGARLRCVVLRRRVLARTNCNETRAAPGGDKERGRGSKAFRGESVRSDDECGSGGVVRGGGHLRVRLGHHRPRERPLSRLRLCRDGLTREGPESHRGPERA
jgi:hypothetical protein